MRRVLALALAAALLGGAISAAAQQGPPSDWERAQREKAWRDTAVKLPAYPKQADLVRFEVVSVRDFKFYIDRTSVSVQPDGVVRYTLVARSPSGADNVSYEGMRCYNGSYKVYAFGGPGGSWHPDAGAKWKPIVGGGIMPWRRELQRDFWCSSGLPPADTAAALAALRRGPPDTGAYTPSSY